METQMLLLEKPRRDRRAFLVPVPLYGRVAQLFLPVDMTEAEAQKLSAVILAYAKITPFMSHP